MLLMWTRNKTLWSWPPHWRFLNSGPPHSLAFPSLNNYIMDGPTESITAPTAEIMHVLNLLMSVLLYLRKCTYCYTYYCYWLTYVPTLRPTLTNGTSTEPTPQICCTYFKNLLAVRTADNVCVYSCTALCTGCTHCRYRLMTSVRTKWKPITSSKKTSRGM